MKFRLRFFSVWRTASMLPRWATSLRRLSCALAAESFGLRYFGYEA